MRLRKGNLTIANIIALIILIALPYDSLTYLLGLDSNSISQTLPFVALVSPIYLFIIFLKRINFSFKLNISLMPIIILAYLIIVTIVNVVIENNIKLDSINSNLRINSSFKQFVSFFLGIIIFYAFNDIFKRLKNNSTQILIILATIPTLLLCFYQLYSGLYRIQGFSSEPSHLADYLVWIFIIRM